MRLIELSPRWLSADVFTFKCPHCQTVNLMCKRVPLLFKEQVALINPAPEYDEDWPIDWIPAKADVAWQFNVGEPFETMNVSPSIDPSASEHWHGWIRNGEIA